MLQLRILVMASLVAAGAGVGAGTATAAPNVLTPPRSIAADCSADVSRPLQKFFDQIPDGTRVELARGGCYRIERQVTVHGKTGFVLDGRGAEFRRTTRTPDYLSYPKWNGMLRFGDLQHSTITNIRVRGINTVSDLPELRPQYGAWKTRNGFDHGIAISGGVDVTVSHADVDAVFGDGVYIGGSDRFSQAKNIRLTDIRIDRNGRQAIAITSANRVLLDRVTIAHARRSGVDMEPHRGKVVSHVEIRDSQFVTRLLAITGAGVGRVNNVYVHGNTFHKGSLPVIHDNSSGNVRARRTGWTIVDNTVGFTVRSSVPAMTFDRTDGILVQGNRATFELGSGLAVGLTSSTADVRCNHFPGALKSFVRSDRLSTVRQDHNSVQRVAPTCAAATAPSWAHAEGPSKPKAATQAAARMTNVARWPTR